MAEDRRTTKDSGTHGPGNDALDEHGETVREGYDAAREPERQGDGDPGTERSGEDAGSPGAGESAVDDGQQVS